MSASRLHIRIQNVLDTHYTAASLRGDQTFIGSAQKWAPCLTQYDVPIQALHPESLNG